VREVEFKYYVERQVASMEYAVYKIRRDSEGHSYWSIEKNDWVGPFARYTTWRPEPIFLIEGELIGQFAQALTDLGFTPSEYAAKTGELTATKVHLEDMRRLVFEEPKPFIKEVPGKV
jgi:hypothetical protein